MKFCKIITLAFIFLSSNFLCGMQTNDKSFNTKDLIDICYQLLTYDAKITKKMKHISERTIEVTEKMAEISEILEENKQYEEQIKTILKHRSSAIAILKSFCNKPQKNARATIDQNGKNNMTFNFKELRNSNNNVQSNFGFNFIPNCSYFNNNKLNPQEMIVFGQPDNQAQEYVNPPVTDLQKIVIPMTEEEEEII